MNPKFKGLNNKELTYIYLSFKEMIDDYESIIAEKGISHSFKGPIGEINFFQSLDESKIENITNSEKIVCLRSITEKLGPIVELIYDTDPNMVNLIKDTIETPLITRFDESDEEDM